MGIWDSITGGLGKLFSGAGKAVGGAVGGLGNLANNLLGSGQASQGFSSPSSGSGWGNLFSNMWGGGGGGATGAGTVGNTGIKNMIPGLATIFGSQLIGNPKPPSMPDSFNQFMSQMNAGGTPGMQSANQYYQGVLSGQNKGLYDAAASSLDQSYEEELRKLNSMYKSLRPGTDPTSDSTYQRDLNLLNQNYAQNRANVMAQVQQGAAQGLSGLGAQQMSGQMAAIEAQVNQIASQWGMNYAQKDALRKQLMGIGGGMLDPSYSLMQKLFNR